MYDFQKSDYVLLQICVGIELESSSLTVDIGGRQVHLPVNWFVIVCDKANGVMDTIQVHELTNTNFKLFVGGAKNHTVEETGYRVVNFSQSRTFFHPALTKHQLLCIGIDNEKWILTAPIDLYQKYIKHSTLYDFLL